jgi:hypothetical protein
MSPLTELRAKRARYMANISYFVSVLEDIDRDIAEQERRLYNGKALPRPGRKRQSK